MSSHLENLKGKAYLHGYSMAESERLLSQNQRLAPFIYKSLDFSEFDNLVEIGCGVGAQMIYLLKKYPHLHITGVDIAIDQLAMAKHYLLREKIPATRFDLYHTNSNNTLSNLNRFDAVLITWVLEHVNNPLKVIEQAYSLLKPGGIIYITEVSNSSLFLSPPMPSLEKYWSAINEWQLRQGEDPNIGMKLGTYLNNSSFINISKWVFPMFFDKNDYREREMQFEYWYKLMKSAEQQLLQSEIIDKIDVDKFETEWKILSSNENAIFYYHFAQASAQKPIT